jgi:hypothetical protein
MILTATRSEVSRLMSSLTFLNAPSPIVSYSLYLPTLVMGVPDGADAGAALVGSEATSAWAAARRPTPRSPWPQWRASARHSWTLRRRVVDSLINRYIYLGHICSSPVHAAGLYVKSQQYRQSGDMGS